MFTVKVLTQTPRVAFDRFNRLAITQAEEKGAKYLVNIIRPQLPIRTGQLRASYHYSRARREIGPRRTKRWDSSLRNSELAEILDARGYIEIRITRGQKAQATKLTKQALINALGKRKLMRLFVKGRPKLEVQN
jgi:hypothetical protein